MKNLKDFLIREGYIEYDQADDYLKKVKGKEMTFDELKKGLDKECYIDDVEFEDDVVSAFYNPYNNANGPDVILTIELEENPSKNKLIVKNWKYEEC